MMGRNLVMCFDGTNNRYAATNTNVVKIYAMVEENNAQIAYYQPGIGTILPVGLWGKLKRKVVQLWDSATAWMLDVHVLGGYRFLMNNYQDGDHIFIFGFSRGAYTARVLAGMLHKVGLLSANNVELVPFAWDLYKNSLDKKVNVGFKQTFSREVKIHFLGLWDTVSSIGSIWNPGILPYTANNPDVRVCRHAISLDERRVAFPPNRWGHDASMGTDVLQEWFAGVHSDVGGGYLETESGLSKIPLRWMVEHAKQFGLLINQTIEAEIIPVQSTQEYSAPDVTAKQHASLTGWWWIAECIPAPRRDPLQNYKRRWILHLGRHRSLNQDDRIHASVYERMRKKSDYRPPNLPK